MKSSKNLFFLLRMDQDHTLQISFDEWRSFFMANPVVLESVTRDPREMLRYWRSASVRY